MAAPAQRRANLMTRPVEKLDTGRPASSGSLIPRTLSALVLVPLVLGAVHAGGRPFAALIAFAVIVMLFEWTRMVERRELSNGFYALSIGAAGSMFAAASGAYMAAFGLCAASGAAAWLLARREGGLGFWPALAAPYILAPSIALIWLRFDVENGRALTFLLFIIVWAADTGAFFLGKFIGGPKISHALSPSKTWAGIAGGVIGGALAGGLAAVQMFGAGGAVLMVLAAGALGAVSVVGDLVESAFKRNFGLKDISGFSPGHGGALDRLDGMIFATIAMTGALFLYMVQENLQG